MRKNISRTMSGVILLSSAFLSLSASTVVPLSFKELSTRAHRVTVGRIQHIASARDAATGRIVSKIEIGETHSLSGAGTTIFRFEMVGGTADGIRQWIAGFPSFEVGDRVVLFLGEDTASPLGPTIGLWQGVFFLQTDASGVEVVTNHARRPLSDIKGDEMVIEDLRSGAPRAATPGQRVTLESFLGRVREWRGAR